METVIAYSPFDALVAKLQKKGYREFSMTRVGFTSGNGSYYEPRDLTILKVYHFEDVINPKESFDIYTMKDKNGNHGYSIDASVDYEINEQSLLHWFITKVPGNNTVH